MANSNEVKKEFGFELINKISKKYNAVVLAVAHHEFLNINLQSYLCQNGVLFDVKGILNKDIVDGTL